MAINLEIRSKKQHNDEDCKNIHPSKKHAIWALEIVEEEFEKNNQLFLREKVKLYNESKSIFESYKQIHGYFHSDNCNICVQMQEVSKKFEWLDRAIFVRKRKKSAASTTKGLKKDNKKGLKKQQDDSRLLGPKRGNMIPKGPIIPRIGRNP